MFYVLLALFFVLGAGVVLYAQGWRLDLATWRAEKVGAIYVRSFPADAHITLNGVPITNQSGFLSRGTFVSELFPRTYSLILKKNGYLDWHENAAVLPSFVTEFKYAVLVPSAPTAIATGTVKDFFVASGETVTQTPDGAIQWRGKTVARGNIISESTDLKTMLLQNATTGVASLYNFNTQISTILPTVFWKNNATIDPYDDTDAIATNGQTFFLFDGVTATTSAIGRAGKGELFGTASATSPTSIAWTEFRNTSGTTAVILYDRFAKTILESSSTLPGQTRALAWIAGNRWGALQNDGSLYIYDANAGQFKKLADDVRMFTAATDSSAIAALETKSIEILPLTDAQTYHRFNLPDVANTTELMWYHDANHLFVVSPGSVSLLDLDDLGLRNFVKVSDTAFGTNPIYKPDQNVLYLINPAQKLTQFDFSS